jgi:hypothetical protein
LARSKPRAANTIVLRWIDATAIVLGRKVSMDDANSEKVEQLRRTIDKGWLNHFAAISGRRLTPIDVEVEVQLHKMESILAEWETRRPND